MILFKILRNLLLFLIIQKVLTEKIPAYMRTEHARIFNALSLELDKLTEEQKLSYIKTLESAQIAADDIIEFDSLNKLMDDADFKKDDNLKYEFYKNLNESYKSINMNVSSVKEWNQFLLNTKSLLNPIKLISNFYNILNNPTTEYKSFVNREKTLSSDSYKKKTLIKSDDEALSKWNKLKTIGLTLKDNQIAILKLAKISQNLDVLLTDNKLPPPCLFLEMIKSNTKFLISTIKLKSAIQCELHKNLDLKRFNINNLQKVNLMTNQLFKLIMLHQGEFSSSFFNYAFDGEANSDYQDFLLYLGQFSLNLDMMTLSTYVKTQSFELSMNYYECVKSEDMIQLDRLASMSAVSIYQSSYLFNNIIDPCSIFAEFTSETSFVPIRINKRDGINNQTAFNNRIRHLFSQFRIKDPNKFHSFRQKSTKVMKDLDLIKLSDLEYQVMKCHESTYEIMNKGLNSDKECYVATSDGLDCVYIVKKSHVLSGQMAVRFYSVVSRRNPCDDSKCDVSLLKVPLSDVMCSDGISVHYQILNSIGKNQKIIGSEDTCLLKVKYDDKFLCFTELCSITVETNLLDIRIQFKSSGPMNIILYLNEKEHVKKMILNNQIDVVTIPLTHDGLFKIYAVCNTNRLVKEYQRNHDAYCKHWSSNSRGQILYYMYCYYSDWLLTIMWSSLFLFLFSFVYEILCWIIAVIYGSTFFINYCIIGTVLQCSVCRYPKFLKHKCKCCYYCEKKIHPSDIELNLHKCNIDDVKSQYHRIKRLGEGFLAFITTAVWLFMKLSWLVLVILSFYILAKSADADDLLDLKTLKDLGFQEFSSRVNPTNNMKKSISIVVDQIGELKFVYIKGLIPVTPGSTASYKYNLNGIPKLIDIRVDNTYRKTIISYKYTTCKIKMNVYHHVGCSMECDECLSNINKTHAKDLLRASLKDIPQLTQHMCKNRTGGWGCGCGQINSGAVCAMCSPQFDESDCHDVYKIIKNIITVNMCIYQEGKSFCKIIGSSDIEMAEKMQIYLTPTIRDREVGHLIAIKNKVVKSGAINDYREFGLKFGNFQKVKPNKIINGILDMSAEIVCSALEKAVYTIHKCANDLYSLNSDLVIEGKYDVVSENQLMVSGEHLGNLDFILKVPYQEIQIVLVAGAVKEAKIINSSGCYNCKEGAYVQMHFKLTLVGIYRIICNPPLLRELQYLDKLLGHYKFSLYVNQKEFKLTCGVLNVMFEKNLILNDPKDHLIDIRNEIKEHITMGESECSGFLNCLTSYFFRLLSGNFLTVIFKLITMVCLIFAGFFIIISIIKLIRMVINKDINVKDELMKIKEVSRSRNKGLIFDDWMKKKAPGPSLENPMVISDKKILETYLRNKRR